MGSHRRAVTQGDGIQAHHTVLEQVRLHHTTWAHAGASANADQIRLGQPVGIQPSAPTDLRAQCTQEHVEAAGAHRVRQEPRAGHGLHKLILQLVEPHEGRPQLVLARLDALHAQPLHQHRHRRCHETSADQNQAGDREGLPNALVYQHPLQRQHHARRNRGGGHRRQQAQGLHDAAGHLQSEARVVGAGLSTGLHGHAAQTLRRGTQPVAAGLRLHRGGGEHGHQRVLLQRAIRAGDTGVTQEGTLTHLRVTGKHPPATAELVAADHRVIRQERALAHLGEARHHHGGGDLRILAHLGAQTAEPQRG